MQRLFRSAIFVGALFVFSIIGLLLPVILEPFHIVPRLWVRASFYWLSGILGIILFLLLVAICVFRFRKRNSFRIVSLVVVVVFLPIFLSVGFYSCFACISDSTAEWVAKEGQQRWIYEREPQDPLGGGPYVNAQYEYLNWFVRGDEIMNPLDFM